MLVAKITQDSLDLSELLGHTQVGKRFEYQAMKNWYWNGIDVEELQSELEFDAMPKTRFRLYDDDGELYYAGWLKNDDSCIVQQFVLKWAEVDSGCTTIMVYKSPEEGWVQEIG